jgi:hypothetical protein
MKVKQEIHEGLRKSLTYLTNLVDFQVSSPVTSMQAKVQNSGTQRLEEDGINGNQTICQPGIFPDWTPPMNAFERRLHLVFRHFGMLPVAINDPPARQVVWRHLHTDSIAQQNADVILSHFARKVSQDFVTVVQAHLKLRGGKGFDHKAFHLNLLLILNHLFLQTRGKS